MGGNVCDIKKGAHALKYSIYNLFMGVPPTPLNGDGWNHTPSHPGVGRGSSSGRDKLNLGFIRTRHLTNSSLFSYRSHELFLSTCGGNCTVEINLKDFFLSIRM